MSEQQVSKPWYRYPIVWLVFGIPAVSVVSGLWFVYTATTNPNDLVKDNYYKEGKAINQQFAEDEYAKALNLSAKVTVTDSELSVIFDGPDYPFIAFDLFHFNDKDFDFAGALAKVTVSDGTSRYVYRFDEPLKGLWYIQLKGKQDSHSWRLKGKINLTSANTLTLLPAAQ